MTAQELAIGIADALKDAPAIVQDWFFHGKDDRAVAARNQVKQLVLDEMNAARARQARIHEELRNEPEVKVRHIKRIGVIDPVIAQDMRNRYGSNCWNDRSFIEHTKKEAPELFVEPSSKK